MSLTYKAGAGGPRPSVASSRRRSHRAVSLRRMVGLILILAGLGLVLVPAALLAYESWQQRQLTQQWHSIVSSVPAPAETAPPDTVIAPNSPAAQAPAAVATAAPVRPGGVPIAFAIRVPRLNYYSAVVEGVDVGHLALGPGHYPNTPYPGRPGNVGIAAHNSYWLGFGELRAGDKIVLETRYGTFTYLVTGTRIVQPDDRTVFSRASGYRLTMTTCWPLWAGALATRRYVISAEEQGGVA